MKLFRQFTWQSLKANRSRTLVTIIGIILSVALLTAVAAGAYSGHQYMVEVSQAVDGNYHAFGEDLSKEALAKLEIMGKLKAVITQNIDELHQRAGSKNVIELHGTAGKFTCASCGKKGDTGKVLSEIKDKNVPRCECGGIMKPKVVLYGENLYDGVAESAVHYIENADMLIVGGTSLAVYPAASFVRYFRGKYIVMINKSETEYDGSADLVIRENIGEVFRQVMDKIEG